MPQFGVQLDTKMSGCMHSSMPPSSASPLRAQQAVDVLMPKRNRRQPLTRAMKTQSKQAAAARIAIAAFIPFIILSLLLHSSRPCQTMQSNPRPSCFKSDRLPGRERCGVRRLPRASFTASLSLSLAESRSHTLELWKQQHDVAVASADFGHSYKGFWVPSFGPLETRSRVLAQPT